MITAGYGTSNDLSSAEVYDPATGFFSPVGSMATPRVYHTATLLNNGTVLITGGYHGDFLASAEVYDPATNHFSPTGNLTTSRQSHAATLRNAVLALKNDAGAGSLQYRGQHDEQ